MFWWHTCNCYRQFWFKRNLVKHQRKEHSFHYKCGGCTREFSSKSMRDIHQIYNHPFEEEKMAFINCKDCTFCIQYSGQNSNQAYKEMEMHVLMKHSTPQMKTENKEENMKYLCTEEGCGAEFDTSDARFYHGRLMHKPVDITEEMEEITCHFCPEDGNAFTSGAAFDQHLSLLHGVSPELLGVPGVLTESRKDEDVVNHLSHYTAYKGVEIIQLTEQMNFNRGNAVKYIARAGLKDASKEIEDLEKAEFYVRREIERIKVNATITKMENL